MISPAAIRYATTARLRRARAVEHLLTARCVCGRLFNPRFRPIACSTTCAERIQKTKETA